MQLYLIFGADKDVSLTHVADEGLLLNGTSKLYFEDGTNKDQYIGSSGSGKTSIAAPTVIDLTAPTLDINSSTEVNMNTPSLVVESSTSANPLVQIKNTNADGKGATLRLIKDSASPASDDVVGNIDFYGEDDADNTQEYGHIKVRSTAVVSDSESGKMTFGVACTGNGSVETVLTIAGGANAESSTVTVAGDLTVMGTTTTVNSTTVTIDDPIFTLGGDSGPTSDDNKDRGIEFRWHNGISAKLGFLDMMIVYLHLHLYQMLLTLMKNLMVQ